MAGDAWPATWDGDGSVSHQPRGAGGGGRDPGWPAEITVFGSKGQLGGMITLLNLRLDFAILGALAGPAVLGTYAVASKYAEILRLPGTALTWVTYPEFAGMAAERALARARRLVVPALLCFTVAAGPLLLLAGPVIGLLYGSDFHDAVTPARILLLGMLLGGAAGVASGFLYGRGRPGLNSLALALGLVVTTVLDVLLIPKYGAIGAAYASTVAYLVSDGALTLMLLRHRSSAPGAADRRTLRLPGGEPVKARALVALAAVLVLSACSGDVTQRTAPTVPAVTRGPVAAAASGDPYLDLARTLHDRGVDVWFEADLVKRWLEGPAALDKAVAAARRARPRGPGGGLQDRRRARVRRRHHLRRAGDRLPAGLPGCRAPGRPRRAGARRRARAPARLPGR